MNTVAQSTSGNIKVRVGEDLKLLLANTYLLYVKTQNFHWNVRGPRFQQLHAFFEEQYTALAAAIDEIAEQVRILGDRPPSSLKEFLELTSLKESFGELSENDMLTELLSDHEAIVQQLEGAIDNAQEAKDESTADLLIDRMRDHEKIAWMIRSHLG